MQQSIALRCHMEECSRPWAHIYNGVLTVESVHGGNRHTNAVSLDVLLKLLRGSAVLKSETEIARLLDALQLPMVTPVLAEVPQNGKVGYGR